MYTMNLRTLLIDLPTSLHGSHDRREVVIRQHDG
jgi:hypothetical protein